MNVGRWASYAVAGAATAIAATNDAEAAILYSGVLNTSVGAPPAEVWMYTLISNSHPGVFKLGYFKHLNRGSIPFPVNQPATAGAASGHMLAGHSAFHTGSVGGQIRGYKSALGSIFASRLLSHANIAGGHFNTAGKNNILASYFKGFGSYGQFQAVGTGFLGFEFNLGGGEQYGWARVNMTSGQKFNNFKLVDYAYGTVGQAITVGQTATPEPASLSLLAFGAVGLLVDRGLRRRKPRPAVD